MKTNIRRNTFETNSSSMHSLILVNDDQYKKFQNYEMFITLDGEMLDWNDTEYTHYYNHDSIIPKYKEKLFEIIKTYHPDLVGTATELTPEILRAATEEIESRYKNDFTVEIFDVANNANVYFYSTFEIFLDEDCSVDRSTIATPHGDLVHAISFTTYED